MTTGLYNAIITAVFGGSYEAGELGGAPRIIRDALIFSEQYTQVWQFTKLPGYKKARGRARHARMIKGKHGLKRPNRY